MPGPKPTRPEHPRRLPDCERAQVLEVLHEPRFVDLAPLEVYAALLQEGHGRVEQRIAERQGALDAAFALHPERFTRVRPIAQRPPREVWINKPVQLLTSASATTPTQPAALSTTRPTPLSRALRRLTKLRKRLSQNR